MAPPASEDEEAAGINRLRDTAKWLIGAYAAVGTVLIAGLQLTSLGKIEDKTRLWVALLTALVALVAVAIAIWKVSRVLAPVTVEPEDLAEGTEADKMVKKTPVLLKAQAPDLQTLQTRYWDALKDRERTRAEALKDKTQEPAAEQAYQHVVAVGDPLTRIRKIALFIKVQARFDAARNWLAGTGLVAAICVIAFAWAASPSEESQAEAKAKEHGPTLQEPSRVRVSVSKVRPSLASLRSKLGKHCELNSVAALVVGGTSSAPEVITLPTGNCNVVRFTASENIGIVLPASPVGP